MPVQAFAALRPSSVESRFEALRTSDLTALVGRNEELEVLLRLWGTAKSGEGQVVLLSGEAGIGKSRLTAAVLEAVASEPHTRLRYFCSPQHTDSALYPAIAQMERAAGLTHDDTSKMRLDKLDTVLTRTSTPRADAALLAEMLSLPNDGRYPALELAPHERRQKTLEALGSHLEALARQNPVLMIFEDAHWADPTSLELFGRTVDRIANVPALLIVTFRPELVPSWIGLPRVTALTINRLAQHDIDIMIDRVVGSKSLPASIRHDIIERTDGIPLFVEEMTRAVLEAGTEDAPRQAAAIPSPALAIPASLHASLTARLDRLGSAKETAQIGAAIGREFSHALLAAVAGKSEAELETALDRLMQSGLLFRQGVPPHASYLFKHALVQDAAYGSLLRAPRRALHARIAEILEAQFPEIAESQPELLARHCTEAVLVEKAAAQWAKAGRRSLARSALVEAADQLTRALGQIAALPATPALRREQIKLQIELSNALIHTRGHASPETQGSFDRARAFIEEAEALGEPSEDPLLLFSVLYGFWVRSRMAFNGDMACELAEQFQRLSQKQNSTVPLMIGHMLMGISLVLVGSLAEGRKHLDQVIGLYDAAEHRPLATRFGHDVRMSALCWRALAGWMLGYPDAAHADAEHALKDAREVGHAATSMFALSHTSMAFLHSGHCEAASALINELNALADEIGSLYWKSYGTLLQGGLFTLNGDASGAVATATPAIAAARSTGATAYAPWYCAYLAKAHAKLGQFDDAWRYIGEAVTAVETTKERWFEAEVHRIAGEIALKSDEPDAAKAEAYFARALEVARQQQAKSWELRAATSMARLLRGQGKGDEARNLLAPVYNWFTEGFDTLDLKEAKALLSELK